MHCRCPPWPQQHRQRHRQTPSAAPLQPNPSLNHHNPSTQLLNQTHKILLRLHCKNHNTKQTNQDAADDAGRDSEAELQRHCKQGHLQEALETLRLMADSADAAAYAAVLHSCAAAGPDALKYAQALHRLLRKHRQDLDPVLVPVLVHAFCACGGLLDARLLVDKAVAADADADPVSLFRLLLSAYVRHGCFREALLLHARMPPVSRSDDAAVALALALKSARALRLLRTGRALHGRAVRSELHGDGGVRSALVAFYSDCGAVGTARRVFDSAPPAERSAATWNSMIAGYAHAGDYAGALNMLRRMDRRPDLVTVVSALPACTDARDVRALHGAALRAGLAEAVAVGNVLVKAYGGVERVRDAAAVFESMPRRDAVSWNSLMSAFAHAGEHARAVELFRRMDAERVPANPYTLSSLLASCARAADLEQGRRVHGYAVRAAAAADVSVANSLLQMYVRCGRLRRARQVFEEMPRRDAVSWNTMLGGLRGAGRSREALELFRRMDFPPSLVTCLCLLSVSAQLRIPLHGREVHAYMLKTGLLQADAAARNAVVAMYSKCGHLRDAAAALPVEPDAAAWTAMIQGYGAGCRAGEALAVFEEMAASRSRRVRPNGVTVLVLLCVCGRGGLVERGKRLFREMEAVHGVPATVKHCAAMVDLLGRAGMFREAREFIERMPTEPDAAVWGALLGALRIHGRFSALAEQCARMVLRLAPHSYGHWVLVQRVYMDAGKWDAVARIRAVMRRRGLIRRPPACSWIEVDGQIHAFVAGERCSWVVGSDRADEAAPRGLAKSGNTDGTGCPPVVGSDGANSIGHGWVAQSGDAAGTGCSRVIGSDGADRTGQWVVGSDDIAGTCPIGVVGSDGADRTGCGSLVGSDDLHGTNGPGMVGSDSPSAGHQGMIGSDGADKNLGLQWVGGSDGAHRPGMVGSDGARCPRMVESDGVDRSPRLQWVVGGDGADGDRLPGRAEEIDEVLRKWAAEMAEEGFRWPGNFVVSNELHAVASEEDVVCGHTEKLAVAFGLVATPRLKKLTVVKNVKVCRYCHDALRFVSKVSGREITVQDPEHVHVFRDGYCCCGS